MVVSIKFVTDGINQSKHSRLRAKLVPPNQGRSKLSNAAFDLFGCASNSISATEDAERPFIKALIALLRRVRSAGELFVPSDRWSAAVTSPSRSN